MLPRSGITVDVTPRDFPLTLVGIGGGALALWAAVPVNLALPLALLIALDVRVSLNRRT